MNAIEFFFFRIVPAFLLAILFVFLWLPHSSPEPAKFCILLASMLIIRFPVRRKNLALAIDASFLLVGALALFVSTLILSDVVHRQLRGMPDGETYIPIADIESGKRAVPKDGCLILGGPLLCHYSQTKWGPDKEPSFPISTITPKAKKRILVRGWLGDEIPPDDRVVDQLLVFSSEGKLRARSLVRLRFDEAERWAGLGAVSFSLGLFLFIPNVRRQWRERSPKPLPCDREL